MTTLLHRRPVCVAALALTLVLSARPALGHGRDGHDPSAFWSWWTLAPEVVIPMLLASVMYGIGARRVRRRSRSSAALPWWAALSYWSGMTALFVALISPLDTLGAHLFSAHMLQHVLLMLVAAPLLVLGRPLVAMAWALPARWRRPVGDALHRRPVRAMWRAITNPYVAWLAHACAVWLWHAPPLYQATLYSNLLHALQHLSFFGTALLFWWAAAEFGRRRSRAGTGVLYIFSTALHGTVLGALITFSTTIWYPAYTSTVSSWGLTVLEDQQLGGLVMWVPAGVIYVIAALACMATLLRGAEGSAGSAAPDDGPAYAPGSPVTRG